MHPDLQKIEELPYVSHVGDGRADGNRIMIVLQDPWHFRDNPRFGFKAVDSVSEAIKATQKDKVYLNRQT